MGWYEAIKDLLTVADRLRDADLKHRLADVQMEGAKLAEENAHLRQELINCRQQLKTRQEMHYRDGVYWRKLEDGKEEGPFCQKCFDGNDKTSRMTDRPGEKNWRCSVCGYVMRKAGGDPEPTPRGKPQYY